MVGYDFLTSRNIEEVLDYLDKLEKVKILAGGTDLIVNIHKKSPRLPSFQYLLDISNIEELKNITLRNQFLEIGSLVTHTQLIEDTLIANYFPLLQFAAQTIGSPQIRNRGTIGGNIVNASPAADLIPPLIALRARVELVSPGGKRELTLTEFLTGPYQTKLQENELLTTIRIPLLTEGYFTSFKKIGRRKSLSIARLSLALVTRIDSENIFQDSRIVPGSATPYPQSFSVTEEAVNGKRTTDLNLEEIGEIIAKEMISITGKRWSTPYKSKAIAALIRRALEEIRYKVEKR
ncbi:MAG: hypothetical protein Kow00103_09840 [Candidatus Caldatribacteriota bacterium]